MSTNLSLLSTDTLQAAATNPHFKLTARAQQELANRKAAKS